MQLLRFHKIRIRISIWSCPKWASLIWVMKINQLPSKFVEKLTVSNFFMSPLAFSFLIGRVLSSKNKLPNTSVYHLEMKHDSELKYFKDMALFIKKAMEEKFEDSWHVIVGTNFGSFVSYEHKCICLFWLEHIGFLLFKHGWVFEIKFKSIL